MRWYWIDRFLEFQRGERAVAIKCVAMVEEEIEGYSPGLPHLPFALVIEGMAQTAGLLIGEKNGFEDRVVLAKVNKATFHRPAFPGDTLRYTAVVQDIQRDGAIAGITSHIGDELQGEVEMMFAFLDERFPQGPLFDPVEFLMMIRSFGLYDVGRQADGSPLDVPEFYREAEAAAHIAYEPTRGPVTIAPKESNSRPELAALASPARKLRMPGRHLLLILHGKSAADPRVRSAVVEVRARGFEVEVRACWEAGQAELFAREAAQRGIEVVVAAGGDGTVSAVAAGLCCGDKLPAAALAIMPLGTANDFAHGLRYPLGDPLAALLLAAEGPLHQIDVGRVNGRTFINVASGGFGAEATARTPPGWKDALGGVAYTIVGLATLHDMTPYSCRAILGDQTIEREVTLVAVGNGTQAGGGFQVAPRALLDDGLLDLVLVPAVPFPEIGRLATELLHVDFEENQHVFYRQLPSFELQFDHEFQFNLDGEPLRDTRFRFDVLPKHLRVVVPPPAEPAAS